MICHFTYDLRGYAFCGVFPTWSTTSWTGVTCPACWEKRRADEQEWLSLAILAEYVPAEPQTVTEEVRALLGEGQEFGTAAWYKSLPLIDPETGETENS